MTRRPLVRTSSSPEETRAIAAAAAGVLRAGDVAVLAGDLGAGKTCFVQAAAAALGVTERVTSPTFVLVHIYHGDVRIVHVDVYRLNHLGELIDLGFEEIFAPDAITFIEWGDAVAGELPPHTTITITREDDLRRLAFTGVRAEELARVVGAT